MGKARSLKKAYGKEKSTVAVARVWNREVGQVEEWVATNLPDLPVEIRNNLKGANCKFGGGHAEDTIVGALGDKYDLLGIAASSRMCSRYYDAVMGIPGMVRTKVGMTVPDLPEVTAFRTAVNLKFWNGT